MDIVQTSGEPPGAEGGVDAARRERRAADGLANLRGEFRGVATARVEFRIAGVAMRQQAARADDGQVRGRFVAVEGEAGEFFVEAVALEAGEFERFRFFERRELVGAREAEAFLREEFCGVREEFGELIEIDGAPFGTGLGQTSWRPPSRPLGWRRIGSTLSHSWCDRRLRSEGPVGE